MASVDDRIVAMKFDNRSFEQNIAATLSSLDKLKKSLDFANSAKGLQDISAASSKFNLDGIGSALDGIAAKFTTMGIVGITTLTNLVNKGVDAGIQLAKSLSIDPISSGFQEYQTNINSIQTILANTSSKGTTLDDVNSALDQLNEYSDKTIYNFSQMAKNVGTFTAAGVDLDTSVNAIKGIANLAALSGANAEQASTAMYQLSQAISTGTVRLIDWNSVQNASIGGEVFQKALFETGKALGTIKGIDMDTTFEEWKKANVSFRESLSGTGEQVEDEASKLARSQAEAAKIIGDAEMELAEDTEEANSRVVDAKNRVIEAAEDGADAIASASERQSRIIEDDAKSVKEAWQSVIDARKALERAMQPASENELEAAQDRVTASKLDQADLVDAITRAENQQSKALDRERKAREALKRATDSGDLEAQNKAYFDLQDASNAVVDASDAITRAQLSQRAAARDVVSSQETLLEVQNKGLATDENVIAAKENLESAEQRYVREMEDSVKRQRDAAEDIAKAREDSTQRQEDAVRNLSNVEKDQVEDIIRLQERLAKAHEEAAVIISNAAGEAENAWLTSDVLTTTLQTFTGDLSKAEIMALGYTDAQAEELVKLGALASESATSVKTLTQLLGTVRESVGSGWSESFRTVFGTFEEAKGAFTTFNEQIGGAAKASAQARNDVLNAWKADGGRVALFEGITQAARSFVSYLTPIKEAFREIFPRKTGEELADLTRKFLEFAKRMQASSETANNIKRIFKGVFAAFSIGVTIVKNVIRFFKELVNVFSGVGGSPIVSVLGGVADKLVAIDKRLKEGKGIESFFNVLLSGAKKLATVVKALGGFIFEAFRGITSGALTVGDAIQSVFAKIGAFFGGLSGGLFEKVSQLFTKVSNSAKELTKSVGGGEGSKLGGGLSYLSKVGERLSDIWDRLSKLAAKLKDGFVELAKVVGTALGAIFGKIGEVFGGANFDKTLDGITVGLLAGVVLLFKRFLDGGFIAALGGRDFTKVIKDMFQGLTDVLKAFQTAIKADALLKIGKALALVVASLVVLALIDSKKLAIATVAMTAVLGGLVGALAALSKIGGTDAKSTSSIVGLTAALGVLAGALLIMSFGLKNLSKIDAVSLAAGLAAMQVMTLSLANAMKTLSGVTIKNPIKLTVALFGVATALQKMAEIVISVGNLSVKEAAQGLLGLEAMIEILVTAFQRLPKKVDDKVEGILLFAFAIKVLASAVKDFGDMDPVVLVQGLGALATIMVGVVALFKNLNGLNIASVGSAMAGLALGVVAIAISLKVLSMMSIDDLIKSIGALAVVLPLLAGAMYLMTGTAAGAGALAVVAVSLIVLAKAFQMFADIKLTDIGKGLLAVAGVLGTLVVAALAVASVLPALIGLGVALVLIGAGFALFGVGALQLAEAFELISKVGKAGMKVFKEFLKTIIAIIPDFIVGVAEGIVQFGTLLAQFAPKLVSSFVKLVIQLLQGIRKILPELGKTIGEFIDTMLDLLVEKGPDLLTAGYQFLLNFLKGISDNIKDITSVVIDIVTGFLAELTARAADLATGGTDVLVAFVKGISDNMGKIVDAAFSIISTLIKEMTSGITGLGDDFAALVVAIGDAIVGANTTIVAQGVRIITSLLGAMATGVTSVGTAISDLIIAIVAAMIKQTVTLSEEVPKFVIAVFDAMVAATDEILQGVSDFIIAMCDSFTEAISKNGGKIAEAAGKLVGAIAAEMATSPISVGKGLIDGLTGGILDAVADIPFVGDSIVGAVVKEVEKPASQKKLETAGGNTWWSFLAGFNRAGQIRSPSRVMMKQAGYIVDGLIQGIDSNTIRAENSAVKFGDSIFSVIGKTLSQLPDEMANIGALNPTIAPVLDLTQVRTEASKMSGILGTTSISASVSASQANALSLATQASAASANDVVSQPTVTEVKFEQTINAPTQLSTGDIYRQTKTQLVMAKEELTAA